MLSSRGASSAAIKRLTIEYKQLSSDPNSLFPATGPIDESNYLLWEALVPGPEGTPYEGGVFSARLTFREFEVRIAHIELPGSDDPSLRLSLLSQLPPTPWNHLR